CRSASSRRGSRSKSSWATLSARASSPRHSLSTKSSPRGLIREDRNHWGSGMDRDKAWDLLCEYTKTDALRRHAFSVETVMRAAADRYGANVDKWGLVGLLHDFDYEMYPTEHPMAGKPILEAHRVPDDIVYAIQCHADFTGYERLTRMDKMTF